MNNLVTETKNLETGFPGGRVSRVLGIFWPGHFVRVDVRVDVGINVGTDVGTNVGAPAIFCGREAGVPGGVANKGKRGGAMRPATREPRGPRPARSGGWPPTPATGWHPSCPWASSASAPMKGAISYHYLHTQGAYNRGYQVGLGIPVKGWASAAEALA